MAYLAGLYGIGRIELPKPDAIVVSSPPPYPIVPAARLAKRHGAKLVFEVRDLWPLSLMEIGSIRKGHPFIRITQMVEDFAYARSDKVVSVLPKTMEYMRSRGLDPSKFVSIPNGIAVSTTECVADPEVRAALPGRRFIVGYAGKLGASNAMDAFIRAAGRLSDRDDVGFAIVGDGAEKSRLAELARTVGAVKNLVFLPRVPKEEIRGKLAAFDAVWVGLKDSPLYEHGVSLTKLFDYMESRKPILFSSGAANDPVTEAGCGITVPPEDDASLAVAIQGLADAHPANLAAMGAAGRRYLEERHDWKILGERYHEALFGS